MIDVCSRLDVALCLSDLDRLAMIITALAGDRPSLGSGEFEMISIARSSGVAAQDLLRGYAHDMNLEGLNSVAASSFDPFGDQCSHGYLRNHFKITDPSQIKMVEHLSFAIRIADAQAYLAHSKNIGYEQLLGVHKLIFSAVYPWAGEDRLTTSPSLSITKGVSGSREVVSFAPPHEIIRASEYALGHCQSNEQTRKYAGTILGNLAYAHPFLDGNGRALLMLHTEICYRAGFCIQWSQVETGEYLKVLGNEIDQPSKGLMNDFLAQFVIDAQSRSECIKYIVG